MLYPEDVRLLDWSVIPKILGKLSLYNLSYLYNYYKETLDLSSSTIDRVYVNSSFPVSRELEKEKKYVNKKCMYNLKLSENMIYWIERECSYRNVDGRFFS